MNVLVFFHCTIVSDLKSSVAGSAYWLNSAQISGLLTTSSASHLL